MLSFDEATALLVSSIAPLGSEEVPLTQAAGRILAEDLHASFAMPRSDVSVMDGYALRKASLADWDFLSVAGEARPGMPFVGQLDDDAAVRVFTGTPIPEGADYVIMQEYARREADKVSFEDGHGPANNIRTKGSDFGIGDILVTHGARLTPRAMVAAAAADREAVLVGRKPRVAIIVTGNELIPPGKAGATPTFIPESASFGIAAMCENCSADIVLRSHGHDEIGELERLAAEALEVADCIVVTGGASVGDHDLARPMFDRLGIELVFSRLAIKPGKPVWLGKVGEKVVLGLPGNPGSAMVTARLFLRPILVLLQGGKGVGDPSFIPMPLAEPLGATGSRETFVRASAGANGLVPVGNQESGAQHPLVAADWLIRRPAHSRACDPGTLVDASPF